MFAIAFDLLVADAADHTDEDDMANLFAALLALKASPWFPEVVRDIRGFRTENWSDFTALIKG